MPKRTHNFNMLGKWAAITIALLGCASCADPNFKLKETNTSAGLDRTTMTSSASVQKEEREEPKEADKPSSSLSAPSSQELTPTPSPSATPIPDFFDDETIHFKLNTSIWELIAQADGVNTYRERNPKQDLVGFRGEATLPTSMERIFAVLFDFSNRKDWVDALVDAKIIEEKSERERIEYNHSKVPWPFHDRDFVYGVEVKIDLPSHSSLITMKSIEDSRMPPQSGLVRGEIKRAYYYMKEIPGDTPLTKVVIEMVVDPKGAIPTWAVNATQKRWPHHTLLALKRKAMDASLVIPPEIKKYFETPAKKGKKKK